MSSANPDPAAPLVMPGDAGALRILVVDADDRTRESIAGILGIRHRFDVVGTAGHVAEAIRLAKAGRPQVVVIDPRLPEVSDGMALIRRLRLIVPGVAILAVGWSPDLESQAMDAGADGFVRKTFKPGDLAGAIARCTAGRELPGPVVAPVPAVPAPVPAPVHTPVAERLDDPVSQSTESPLGPVRASGAGLIL